MKKILGSILLAILFLPAFTQQELHIHHINIEDGDATVIGIWDNATSKYTKKILLDGGNRAPGVLLLPYLKKTLGTTAAALKFDYVILSHFHKDHFKGLGALETGEIKADSVIDGGGYDLDEVFGGTHNVREDAPEKMEVADDWWGTLVEAADPAAKYVKDHSRLFMSYGTTPFTAIGKTLTLGKVGTNKVQLQCVAGWGNTLSDDGIVENPAPGRVNANNFVIAFLLTSGEFRYFLGGDMGGSGGTYIDQETPLTKFFIKKFPAAKKWTGTGAAVAGHICGFKSSHHGSDNSNEKEFMESMHPSLTVVSAGKNKSWHLPAVSFLDRLAEVTPITNPATAAAGFANRGVYFTNLYNFSSANNSKSTAINHFSGQQNISFDYGNNTGTVKAGYMIKVKGSTNLSSKSSYEVYRIDIKKADPFQKLAGFRCHISE